jgi:hypothetical protein
MAPQDPKDILQQSESVTANIREIRQQWSDYVQSGSFQKECDEVFVSACNLKASGGYVYHL